MKEIVSKLKVSTEITSWYGLLSYLNGDLEKSQWSRDNYLDITVLRLIGADIKIHFPPTDNKGLAYLLDFLNNSNLEITDTLKEKSFFFQKIFLENQDNIKAIKSFLEDILNNKECKKWLSWHIKNEWPKHIRRCEGLIEKKYIGLTSVLVPEISFDKIDKINNDAIINAEAFSKNPDLVSKRLYIADVIRRGLHYLYVAQSQDRKQLLHQTRRIPIGVRQYKIVLGLEPFLLAEILKKYAADIVDKSESLKKYCEKIDSVHRAFLQEWEMPDQQIEFIADQKSMNAAVEKIARISHELKLYINNTVIKKISKWTNLAIVGIVGAIIGLLTNYLIQQGVTYYFLFAVIGTITAEVFTLILIAALTKIYKSTSYLKYKLKKIRGKINRSSIILFSLSES